MHASSIPYCLRALTFLARFCLLNVYIGTHVSVINRTLLHVTLSAHCRTSKCIRRML